MSQERDLKGKNVIATGAASGLTKAICENFLKKGINKLAIFDLNEEAGNSVASEFNKTYGADKVVFKKCDASNEGEIDSTVDEIVESFGSIDVLVNGAGLINEKNWRVCVNVNLNALIYLTFKIRNLTRADRGGKGATILNVSSIYGVRPTMYSPVYAATKFGVLGFGKSLGDKFLYERTKVRILTLCPGITDTPILNIPRSEFDPPELAEMLPEHIKNDIIVQSPDHLGSRAVDVFEKGDSGSAWIVENRLEPYQV